MKVKTIVVKDFDEIYHELMEVLARLEFCFIIDEFFPF